MFRFVIIPKHFTVGVLNLPEYWFSGFWTYIQHFGGAGWPGCSIIVYNIQIDIVKRADWLTWNCAFYK